MRAERELMARLGKSLDLGPAAVALLRHELGYRWAEIARSLGASVRTVKRVYARFQHQHEAALEPDRRGRPVAELDGAEIARLRGAGLSWEAIGRKLNVSARTARRAYECTRTTTQSISIDGRGRQKSAKAIPESVQGANFQPEAPPPRETILGKLLATIASPPEYRCHPTELRGPFEEFAWLMYQGQLSINDLRSMLACAIERVRVEFPDFDIEQVEAVARTTKPFWRALAVDDFLEALYWAGKFGFKLQATEGRRPLNAAPGLIQ